MPMFAYVRHFECLGAEGPEYKHSRGWGEKVASHPGPEAALMLKAAGPGAGIDHLINRKAVHMGKTRPARAKMSTKMSTPKPVTWGKLWRILSLFYNLRRFLHTGDELTQNKPANKALAEVEKLTAKPRRRCRSRPYTWVDGKRLSQERSLQKIRWDLPSMWEEIIRQHGAWLAGGATFEGGGMP